MFIHIRWSERIIIWALMITNLYLYSLEKGFPKRCGIHGYCDLLMLSYREVLKMSHYNVKHAVPCHGKHLYRPNVKVKSVLDLAAYRLQSDGY